MVKVQVKKDIILLLFMCVSVKKSLWTTAAEPQTIILQTTEPYRNTCRKPSAASKVLMSKLHKLPKVQPQVCV